MPEPILDSQGTPITLNAAVTLTPAGIQSLRSQGVFHSGIEELTPETLGLVEMIDSARAIYIRWPSLSTNPCWHSLAADVVCQNMNLENDTNTFIERTFNRSNFVIASLNGRLYELSPMEDNTPQALVGYLATRQSMQIQPIIRAIRQRRQELEQSQTVVMPQISPAEALSGGIRVAIDDGNLVWYVPTCYHPQLITTWAGETKRISPANQALLRNDALFLQIHQDNRGRSYNTCYLQQDGSIFAHFHNISEHDCLGNWPRPNFPTCASEAVAIASSLEILYTTINLGDLGSGRPMSTEQLQQDAELLTDITNTWTVPTFNRDVRVRIARQSSLHPIPAEYLGCVGETITSGQTVYVHMGFSSPNALSEGRYRRTLVQASSLSLEATSDPINRRPVTPTTIETAPEESTT